MQTNRSKYWHLAETDEEVKVSELEFMLWRVGYGFLRWQEDCTTHVTGVTLTGDDIAVLHIIRMKERPKTVYELAQLLNRGDIPNVQYSIKKLLKLKLIEKAKNLVKKAVAYQLTPLGMKHTDDYTKARKELFLDLFFKEINLEEVEKATALLTRLKNIYEEASLLTASYGNFEQK
ncbi:MAG: winged helix DNA-binding protein [Gammaproteobacteria bacterium]|nr:winged helix DNA-binding protein [Gammaproteobacteria bacterium]